MKQKKIIQIIDELLYFWKKILSVERQKIRPVVFFVIASSLVEVLSISSAIPFLGFLIAPEKYYSEMNKILNIDITMHEMITMTTVIFILVTILSSSLRIFLLKQINSFSYMVASKLSVVLYSSVLNQKYEDIIDINSSEITATVIARTQSILSLVIFSSAYIIASLTILSCSLVFAFYFYPIAALIVIAFFGSLYFAIGRVITNEMRLNSSIVSAEWDESIKILNEGIGIIRDLILDNTRSLQIQKFEEHIKRLREAEAKLNILPALPKYIMEGLGLSCIAIFAYWAENEGLLFDYLPILGAFAISIQRLLPLLQQFFNSYSNIISGHTFLISVNEFLRASKESKIASENNKITFKNSIELVNVSHRYKKNAQDTLEKVNLKIHKGDNVAVVGKSGSGKSTLIDIISGLITFKEGLFLVDDVPLESSNINSWMDNISHVPQEIFIIDDTLSANIALGIKVSDIDHNKINHLITIVGLDELLMKHGRNKEFKTGERGHLLSGGQKQRLGIARALYKDPKILILDEATNALDKSSEHLVLSSLKKYFSDLTIIYISHNSACLKYCDYGLLVENNSVRYLYINELDEYFE